MTAHSEIASVFLTEFDMKSGYKLQWSKSYIDTNSLLLLLDGIEYKSLPSGIHELEEATVFISHKPENKNGHHKEDITYYGVSCFKQFVITDTENITDRDNLKMYSLGVLCKPSSKESEWKPNEFIRNGWEYIDGLKKILDDLKDTTRKCDGPINLDEFFNQSGTFKKVFEQTDYTKAKNNSNHLLFSLPQLFETLGPLVFAIFKQSLLRRNIMIFNELHLQTLPYIAASSDGSHDDDDDDAEEEEDEEEEEGTEFNHNKSTRRAEKDTYALLTSFSYLFAVLSVIPKDIELEHLELRSQQPLFNVGLHELSSNTFKLIDSNGFIGVTSDEILKNHPIYDVGVEIGHPEIKAFLKQPSTKQQKQQKQQREQSRNLPIKATIRDYHKFQKIFSQLVSKHLLNKGVKNTSTKDHPSVYSPLNNSTTPVRFSATSSSTDSGPGPDQDQDQDQDEDQDQDQDQDPTTATITTSSTVVPPTLQPLRKTYTDLSPSSPKLSNEPSWWRSATVESVSWSESVWSAFSWFASAGQQLENEDSLDQLPQNTCDSSSQIHLLSNENEFGNKDGMDSSLEDIIQTIGVFHKLTHKWFNYIDELIHEVHQEEQARFGSEEDQALVETEVVEVLQISYQDMIEMELDPYSALDIAFLKEFVALYYREKVDRVNVGYSFTNVCC